MDVIFNSILLKPNLFLMSCFEKLYKREEKKSYLSVL